jgi:chorismate mutase
VAGLLLVSLLASGCRHADAPNAQQHEIANLDHLLRLMGRRLALMHDVARWKWNAGKPITDPERERDLLRSVVERGRAKGLDPDRVCAFFAAQIEAARLVQTADFDRWKAKAQEPFSQTTNLTLLRQQIDDLNSELIDALAEVVHRIDKPALRQALSGRAAEILTGNGLAEVRETAIAPLRR